MDIRILEQKALPGGVSVAADADNVAGNPRAARPLAQRRFGVGERIVLRPTTPLRAGLNVSWRLRQGVVVPPGALAAGAGGSATFTAPGVPAGAQTQAIVLELVTAGRPPVRLLAQVGFDVVAPSVIGQIHVADIHYETHLAHAGIPHWNHEPNGGFWSRWVLGPADVCFGALQLKETGGHTWICTGICEKENTLVGRMHRHQGPPGPDGIPRVAGEDWFGGRVGWDNRGTIIGRDRVFSRLPMAEDESVAKMLFSHALLNQPAGRELVGTAALRIDVRCRVSKADVVGRLIGSVTHGFEVYRDGTMVVYKGNNPTVRRSFVRTAPTQDPPAP